MPCAQTTEYNAAIQNLRNSVSDDELRQGEPALNALGVPMPYSGGFADVYKVHCPQTGNTWAVKCFTREVTGQRERYREISAHLDQVKLPFTVDFQYVEPGIRAGGQWYPFLKMRWVEGFNLNQFVSDYLDKPKTLKLLLPLWVKLARLLRQNEVAHADLQHGNVLLVPAGEKGLSLKLIDYDGMYVPSLARTRSGELGHPCFQHPQRLREGTYSLEVDRFSHLAIYCAIQCLIAGRRPLWKRFDSGDNLLFREADFRNPGASAVFQELWTLRDPDPRSLVGHLALATQRPLGEVPLLDDLVREGRVQTLSRAEEGRVRQVLGDGRARGPAPPPPLPASGTAPSGALGTAPAPVPGSSPAEPPWWATQQIGDAARPSPSSQTVLAEVVPAGTFNITGNAIPPSSQIGLA
jgi:serine/threonine protein kinase